MTDTTAADARLRLCQAAARSRHALFFLRSCAKPPGWSPEARHRVARPLAPLKAGQNV